MQNEYGIPYAHELMIAIQLNTSDGKFTAEEVLTDLQLLCEANDRPESYEIACLTQFKHILSKKASRT